MNISERVQKLLQKSEYNEKGQNEIAMEIGIAPSVLSRVKNGDSKDPSASTVVAMAKYFNVSTDYLLGLPDKGISETNIKIYACDDLGISFKAYEQIKAIFKSSNDDMKDICSEMINMISRKIEDNSNGKL